MVLTCTTVKEPTVMDSGQDQSVQKAVFCPTCGSLDLYSSTMPTLRPKMQTPYAFSTWGKKVGSIPAVCECLCHFNWKPTTIRDSSTPGTPAFYRCLPVPGVPLAVFSQISALRENLLALHSFLWYHYNGTAGVLTKSLLQHHPANQILYVKLDSSGG